MSKYNGYTNYATWRVNLELFDGFDLSDMGGKSLEIDDAAELLKEFANELVESDAKGFALDYAKAFLANVNWHEIAFHVVANCYDRGIAK
jgi:hypothetical protein